LVQVSSRLIILHETLTIATFFYFHFFISQICASLYGGTHILSSVHRAPSLCHWFSSGQGNK